jgi:hypothetical protein
MINLLPYDAKHEIRAARTNVMLMRYIIVLAVAIIFLSTVGFSIYTVLMSTKASAENTIKDNLAKASSYTSSENEATGLKNSLSAAKVVLDKEVRYTKVITGIAALMPSGAVIDSLNLSATSFGAPTTLLVYAKTTDIALAIKDRFQASPLFSNVAFTSISSASPQSKDYPITATLSVTINKGAAQ